MLTDDQIIKKISSYKWYHEIEITESIKTPGVKQYIPIQKFALKHMKKINFTGKKVLDIGCRDGLFSFEAEKLGAAEVIGIDNNISLGAKEFLIPFFNSKVQMHELNLYDLTPDHFGLFDIILFPGVLYHLRYPFYALKVLSDLLNENGQLFIETGFLVDSNKRAFLYCPIGDESPYEATSCTFFNIKGLTDTLISMNFEVNETKVFSWKKNLIKRLLSFLNIASADRLTMLCTKQALENKSETQINIFNYWEKVHKIHSP